MVVPGREKGGTGGFQFRAVIAWQVNKRNLGKCCVCTLKKTSFNLYYKKVYMLTDVIDMWRDSSLRMNMYVHMRGT